MVTEMDFGREIETGSVMVTGMGSEKLIGKGFGMVTEKQIGMDSVKETERDFGMVTG